MSVGRIRSLKKTWTGRAVGAGLTALVAATPLTGAFAGENSKPASVEITDRQAGQSKKVAALATDQKTERVVVAAGQTGLPVTLRVGPGFNQTSADSIARGLEVVGCPTTVTNERGFPKRLTVQVGKKSFKFTNVGDAGSTAEDWCLGIKPR